MPDFQPASVPAPLAPPQGGQSNLGPMVSNPALGSQAPQVQLPYQAQQVQQQPGYAPQGNPVIPMGNPYQPQQSFDQNPFAQPGQNPYTTGQPYQSPYFAPPQGYNQQQNVVPPGQVAPQGYQFNPQQPPQPQANPAYQFNPYGQQAQQQQPQQQQPLKLPDAALQAQQQQLQQQGLTAEQLSKQQGGMTQEQIAQVFPDEASRAIFQGMNQISDGTGIDLLAAFGQAYERRDPSLVNERYLSQFDQGKVSILRGQFSALMQAGQQRDAAIEQNVYQMAGGKAQWDAAVQTFNTVADPKTVEAVAAAINSGDPNQLHLAVGHILQFAASGGAMIQRQGQLVTPGGGGRTTQDVMTNDKFRQHLTWLEQAFPVGSPQYNQHYEQLVRQRSQAKAQGF